MISIAQFIKIDRRKTEPLYLQLTYQFINAVRNGLIEEGVKLPGTRVWSQQLGIHRKTVIAAFEELETQNWIRIKPKVGTFVQNPSILIKGNDANLESSTKRYAQSVFHFNRSHILTSPFEHKNCRLLCNDGQGDYRIVKTQELSRFYAGALKRRNIEINIGNYAVQENDYFKNQLRNYLNLTRGFHISKDHLLTAKSRGMLFYVLTKMLFNPKDIVLVGELSLFSLNMILNQEKVQVKTVPLDEQGLKVSYIRETYKKGEIRCVYLNPRQSYPTTVSLSEERRAELIHLAEALDFVIIEDSTDFEFSYQKHVHLPLARTSSRTLHIGSIGKHLHPSFQLSFLKAPLDFIAESKNHVSALNPQGNYVLEQALGEMISEGDYFRYEKKALKIYQERMVYFASLLTAFFGASISFEKPGNGLAFWIVFNEHISLKKLSEELAFRDVFLPRICMYQNKQYTALRLGFAHWNQREMKEFMHLFRDAFQAIQ